MLGSRLLSIVCLLAIMPAYAGVTAERTRVIFNEGVRETSLLLANINDHPVITQVWVDDGDLDSIPDTAIAPVMPLPPVFQLAPRQQRTIRLLATGKDLPKDREALYWLNIYEVPPKPKPGEMQGDVQIAVTIRTQLKVFMRPKNLQPAVTEAPALIEFKLDKQNVVLKNPTPYYLTLPVLEFSRGADSIEVAGTMLAPFSSEDIALPTPLAGEGPATVNFQWLDDDGAPQQGESELKTPKE